LNPENWIVGEEWGDSSEWLKGDEWDSSMNYPFRSAVLGFVSPKGNGRPSTFISKLWANYFNYAPQVSRNLMNSLGTHDTARILTECGGDQELAKLAADVLFTWPGVPSVYYGDEVGMEGRNDPDNRRTMDWDAIENTNSQISKDQLSVKNTNSILDHYRRLISIRRSDQALQSGEPEILSVDDKLGTLSFARVVLHSRRDVTLVAINRSAEARQVAIPINKFSYRSSDFVDALGGQPVTVRSNGQILVSLAPKSAAVLIPRTGSSRRPRLGYGSRRPAQTLTIRKLTS
jgi:cyclomaltodextrinase / maltogenic alpha-amylase / neopullulanase